MVDYDLMDETNGMRYSHTVWRILALAILYVATTALVFLTWNNFAYDAALQYPPHPNNVPVWWYRRAHSYANSWHEPDKIAHDFRLVKNQTARMKPLQHVVGDEVAATTRDREDSENGQSTQSDGSDGVPEKPRLVCYYSTPEDGDDPGVDIRLADVQPQLCTHINIGVAGVHNGTLQLSENVKRVLREDIPKMRAQDSELKLLIWVGGVDESEGFPAMVRNHSTRKVFVQSLKQVLSQYALDGVDLDWEFPSAYNKERQHFSQLLYEIRQEFRRERRDLLISVAVAAPDGIALFAYDVRELNTYADFVNLMTYDYHFYSRGTPFTGINAPLYARDNEHSILATLNINYSVNWWLTNGMDRSKLIVGLPTYGHSFTLVNPFNNAIGAPAREIGHCGSLGFSTYSETCWFISHNPAVSVFFDQKTCSPYLSGGTEWISFENEQSMECKTQFVKSNNLGGVMIFSLNTDDWQRYCPLKSSEGGGRNQILNATFPLIETVKRVLSSTR